MITCSGAGDIEKMPLGIINFLQISIIRDGFYSLLEWNDFVITGHYDHGSKFQSFREVHGADCGVPADCFDLLVKNYMGQIGGLNRRFGPLQFFA